MSAKTPEPVAEAPRDPTLREAKATLTRLHQEIFNYGEGTEIGRLCSRAYDHMAWLLDAYLFDTDTYQDDGGRS